MKTGNLFWRKVWVYGLRALTSLFLLVSLLIASMAFITDREDVYDNKDAKETSSLLLIAVCLFIGSFIIKRDPTKKSIKTEYELLNQIKKSNLKKIEQRNVNR